MAERVAIARLGASGDGIAEGPGAPLFVPGALPGETAAIERDGERARLLAIESASPDRAQPFCPYFDRCGGCVAQHVGLGLYENSKLGRLAEALRRAGLDAPVGPLVDAHGDGRRRVTFHARSVEGRMAVGFMERRSHTLVPIDHCPITVPALRAAPQAAAAVAAVLADKGKPLDLAVTATEGGLDIDVRGPGPLGERIRQRLIAVAGERDLARLSLHGEALVARRQPSVVTGRARVVPRPGGFLQATAAGEAAITAAIAAGSEGAKRVADLFSGHGPVALRLAERAEAHAVESDGASLAALDRAARETPGLRRVTTETRDLFRRPLLPLELERFDAVVLDPPRAGAEAQVRQLTLSSCDRVIMASCDAGTFARDAAALVGAGFALERVTPIDQFKWSAHLEMVGAFRRPRARTRRR